MSRPCSASLPAFPSWCRAAAVSALALVLVHGPHTAGAQTTSQLAAWDGLTQSPFGSLAPVVRGIGVLDPGSNELALRYGRWRYDVDDAVHDNIGLEWTRGVLPHTQVGVTAAYQMVECPTCSAWLLAGVDVEWAAPTLHLFQLGSHHVEATIGVRGEVGGGRYQGALGSATLSAVVAMPVDVSITLGREGAICALLQPGYGYGRIRDSYSDEGGTLPTLAAAIAWEVNHRLKIGIGSQRIVLNGAATPLGVTVEWTFGSHHMDHP